MNSNSAIKWSYAQYNRSTLLTLLHVLEDYKGDHSDVNAIVRFFTYASTYQNGMKGILMGNWGSDFSDGTEPTAWQGSDEILDQ